MATGFTYGQALSQKGWEKAHEILELAVQDFNTRDPVDYEIELELIGDETTAVNGESRLYEINGVETDYENTIEVQMVSDEGLKVDSYSICDRTFHEYGESLGRVMTTSPADWP